MEELNETLLKRLLWKIQAYYGSHEGEFVWSSGALNNYLNNGQAMSLSTDRSDCDMSFYGITVKIDNEMENHKIEFRDKRGHLLGEIVNIGNPNPEIKVPSVTR